MWNHLGWKDRERWRNESEILEQDDWRIENLWMDKSEWMGMKEKWRNTFWYKDKGKEEGWRKMKKAWKRLEAKEKAGRIEGMDEA